MKVKKALFFSAIIAAAILAWLLVLPQPKTSAPLGNKISVVATFYPLAEFARNVGGDAVEVWTATPAGAEPHDFEPSPADIARIYRADVLLANGGVDAWVRKLEPELAGKGVRVRVMADKMAFKTLPGNAAAGQAAESLDPHVWLDPAFAMRQVELIRDILIEADPGHADGYAVRAGNYLSALAMLDRDFKSGLSDCKKPKIIASHDAYGYLGSRYGFTILAIAGISPDAEPSAGDLADLSDLMKKEGLEYVFFESLVSPSLAQTLARETGARVLPLNPLEGLTDSEIAAGKTYLSVMRQNLNELRTAMLCR